MIVYQIVSTQVSRQLPQFATMKAIGYPDRSLAGTVGAMSLLIVVTGFVPALGAALGLYSVIRQQTLLPVAMSEMRLLFVFGAAVAMALISALWRANLSSFPAPELDHIRYVCMVDDARARAELGYRPAYSLRETIRAVLREV